jgi:hypothetical protein
MSSILHPLAIHARRKSAIVYTRANLIAALDVYVFDVKRVHMAGEHSKKCEKDVDQEISAAAGDEEDA